VVQCGAAVYLFDSGAGVGAVRKTRCLECLSVWLLSGAGCRDNYLERFEKSSSSLVELAIITDYAFKLRQLDCIANQVDQSEARLAVSRSVDQ
jgi:hypothetical protein